MPRFYLTTKKGLLVGDRLGAIWKAQIVLPEHACQCVVVDPFQPERVYCGTFDSGLWRSEDSGHTWQQVTSGIRHPAILSVAIDVRERINGLCVVYAGTEPSGIFRSEDGGHTWQERPTLLDIPSAARWSFPRRPHTSHVRWIEPDPMIPGRMYVAIEQGGIMRSHDRGLTWEDHNPVAQDDPHTLRTHRLAPGRIYEAAGGGYAESRDGGDTWRGDDLGLEHSYLFGMAIDPEDPDTIVVSASSGPMRAHNPLLGQATIYRKSAGQRWQESRTGLPNPLGQRIYSLAANEAEPGVFYLATHSGGLYRSADAGLSWKKQTLVLARRIRVRSEEPPALVVVGD